MPSNVLLLHLRKTFPPIIWILTEGKGDGIESRLHFKILSTLAQNRFNHMIGILAALQPKFHLDWSSQLHRLPKFIKNKTFCQVDPVTKFYLFLRMLSHLMIYHDIVRSEDCYKICLGGSLSRNKGCKSFFLCGGNNQWLLCCHDGKACKRNIYYICINVCMYVICMYLSINFEQKLNLD